MTVHAHQIDTATPPAGPGPGPGSGSWSITRVVLGSLAVGAIAALVQITLVFPGDTEPVITGSLLFGFGVGWGVLALLSVRKTSRPQRWAGVPSVAMAVSGAGLMAFSPDDALLTVLNWVWPPLMLILVAWMYARARRALPGRTRWLLTPVFVVLALAGVGAGVQDVTGQVAQDYPAPGQTYSVGDHRLHIDCQGTGGPTVLLFSGMGEFSGSWARITDQVSSTARVCAYDRAGQGWSDDVDHPQDGIAVAADLHALLAAAGEHGPYVLVGHSIGGPYAMTYAARYPDDVAGMVLLDSSSPRQFTEMPDYPTEYMLMKRGLALLPTLARIGLGPVTTTASHLPGSAGELADAMSSTVRAKHNGRDDLAMIPAVFKQAQALTTLADRPLAVVTASENLSTKGWRAAQDRLATLSSDSIHSVAQSSHAGLLEDPQGERASVAAITSVVDAVASGSPVATS